MPKHIRGGSLARPQRNPKVAGVRLDPLPPGTIGQGNNGKKGTKTKVGRRLPVHYEAFCATFFPTILVVLKQKST